MHSKANDFLFFVGETTSMQFEPPTTPMILHFIATVTSMGCMYVMKPTLRRTDSNPLATYLTMQDGKTLTSPASQDWCKGIAIMLPLCFGHLEMNQDEAGTFGRQEKNS